MDEFISADSRGVWDPHNNNAWKGHLRSRKSFGWKLSKHTCLFSSYSNEQLCAILFSAKCRSEAGWEESKRLIAWLPHGALSHQGVLSLGNGSESCPVSSPTQAKVTKSGEFGKKSPLSRECAGPHRGFRLTDQECGSSCTWATRELGSHLQEIIRKGQEFNFGSHSKCDRLQDTRFEFRPACIWSFTLCNLDK